MASINMNHGQQFERIIEGSEEDIARVTKAIDDYTLCVFFRGENDPETKRALKLAQMLYNFKPGAAEWLMTNEDTSPIKPIPDSFWQSTNEKPKYWEKRKHK